MTEACTRQLSAPIVATMRAEGADQIRTGVRGFSAPYTLVLLAAVVATLVVPARGVAHWTPDNPRHHSRHAIVSGFCGKHARLSQPCHTGTQALRVSYCETGGTYSPWANNGQYLGIFQMGLWERARFGHGIDPWTQALAAHRYYALSGWSPWSCAYLTGVL